jgi:hypothetical protein
MKWTQHRVGARLGALCALGVFASGACGSEPAAPQAIGMPPDMTGLPTAPVAMPGMPLPTTTPTASTTAPVGAAGTTSVTPPATGGTAAPTQPATGAAGSGAKPPAAAAPDTCPTCSISADCRGFSFDGLKYSPGGEVLPNKCKPYDATTNNPYAVRCIDAIPNYKTQFPGDEYCVLPPPPEKGFQVGIHPQGNTKAYWDAIWKGDYSAYQNPKPEWVLQPGDERTQNYRTRDAQAITAEFNYYRTYFRMRTGSHHMIVTMHDSDEADGWIPGTGEALPGLFDPGSGEIKGILGGEQRPDDNTPVTLAKPPEDDGLYLTFPANPSIIFNMHHFNATDKPLLREGWINIWREDDARQKVTWYMGMEVGQVITLNVAAGQTTDLHYSWPVNSEMRLIRVFGHRHFWTTNFSTWIKRKEGNVELAYQSYDWFDMPTYRYDSVVKNPMPDPAKASDGAMSGIVTLKPGDQLHFNCHIEFTDKRKATDANAPSPSQIGTLRFANEAYNGEMCIQFGNVTGGSLGLPSVDTSPIPDFAKVTRAQVQAP